MKSSEKKLALIQIITIIILLLDIFVINKLTDYTMIIFQGLILIIIILLLGHEKKRALYEKDIILNILIYCFLYYIIIYLLGIIIGFLRSRYSLTPIGIIRNVFPIILNIIISESLRYEILSKSRNNKVLLIITCLLFTTIDTKLISYAYDLTTSMGLIKLCYMSILPILSKNIFLTYLCYKFGYIPNIIYRIIMEIPTYLLPIIPNINDYFKTIIDLLLPAFILWRTYKEFSKTSQTKNIRKSYLLSRITTLILLIILVITISLTSGIFKYYALAIGSNSMHPKINKGDVVIVEKVDQKHINTLKIGEVLVYKYNDMVIVHRIIKIQEVDGNYYFRTKGDNNDTEDGWTINQVSVVGRAVGKIPYIGIPTVWLSEEV